MVTNPKLRLVDNRIVRGDSTFCQQPEVIAVLNTKEPINREELQRILDIVNATPQRGEYTDMPTARVIPMHLTEHHQGLLKTA